MALSCHDFSFLYYFFLFLWVIHEKYYKIKHQKKHHEILSNQLWSGVKWSIGPYCRLKCITFRLSGVSSKVFPHGAVRLQVFDTKRKYKSLGCLLDIYLKLSEILCFQWSSCLSLWRFFHAVTQVCRFKAIACKSQNALKEFCNLKENNL